MSVDHDPTTLPGRAALRRRYHARRTRSLQGLLRDAESVCRKIGTLRLAAFCLAVLTLAGSARLTDIAGPLQVAALLSFIVFVVFVRLHRSPARRAQLLRRMLDAERREAERGAGRWRELPRDGAGLAVDAGLAEDLGLVGPWSLFQFLSRCSTSFGERALARSLTRGTVPEDLAERQEAVRELKARRAFSQRLEAEGAQGTSGGDAPEGVALLLDRPSLHDTRTWLVPLCLGLVVSTWVQGVLHFVFGWSTLFWLSLALQLLVSHLFASRALDEYGELLPHERSLLAWTDMLSHVENTSFRSSLLVDLKRRLSGGVGEASGSLRLLSDQLGALSLRQGSLHPLVNALFLWDLLHTSRLARWRRSHGAHVLEWFKTLGELEALCSLGASASELLVPVFPQLDKEGPVLEATDLAHPLLSPDEVVANDVCLDASGTLVLLTGSNMAGKSTFLRTIGLNAVLAQAGAAVHASSFSMHPVRLVSSIHVTDALDAGVSLFYAEVRRIKTLLELVAEAEADAEAPAVLFLIDEILRGTNTRERLVASRAIVKKLASSRSAGLVTSHELGLADLAEELPTLRNHHFEESVKDGLMSFDYKLKDGPVASSNALAILKAEGLDLDLDG